MYQKSELEYDKQGLYMLPDMTTYYKVDCKIMQAIMSSGTTTRCGSTMNCRIWSATTTSNATLAIGYC